MLVTLTQAVTGARIEITVDRDQNCAFMEMEKRFNDDLVGSYIRNLESQGARVIENTKVTTDLKDNIALRVHLRIARGEEGEVVEMRWTAISHRMIYIVASAPEKSLSQTSFNWQTVRNSLKIQ